MHELAIAQRIVNAAEDAFLKVCAASDRVASIRVVAGGLHQLVPDFLNQAYGFLVRDSVLEGSRLDLSVLPVTGRCRDCAWEGEMQVPFFECGSCGGRSIETLSGHELYLETLEIEAA